MRNLVACSALAIMMAACGGALEPAGETPAAEEPAAEEHEHAPDPSDRVAWSKPQQVYDFLGVAEGQVVVDVMAGGGFNTALLAERVGSSGKVIAERGNNELMSRVAGGDLAALGNIEIVGDLAEIPDGSLDAALAVRAYHLFPDVPAALAQLYRAVAPGGVVGIVEVRLNQEYGHDMTSHRMGEQTVIDEMTAAGFEYVEASDLLRVDGDDYTQFRGGQRHMTDRMLLKFRKPQ